jgi:hypothetical protein
VTVEQFGVVVAGLTGLIIAVTGLWRAVTEYHHQVNSRLDQLLKITAASSFAEGARTRSGPGSLQRSTKPPIPD